MINPITGNHQKVMAALFTAETDVEPAEDITAESIWFALTWRLGVDWYRPRDVAEILFDLIREDFIRHDYATGAISSTEKARRFALN